MPKMKTNSSAKKRFKITASGKVCSTTAGKNHFRRNKTQRMIRDSRGTQILKDCDAKLVIKMLPYA
jgi:large subunit ribosomal protein L35